MRISDWSSDVCSSDLAELTVAAAHGDHAQLALERHEGFEDQPDGPGLRAERLPGGVGGGTCFGPDAELPLAVVAQSPGLEDALRADRRSEERRGGKECVSTCSTRWAPYT